MLSNISGFPELSLSEQNLQNYLVNQAAKIFYSYGYKNILTKMVQDLDSLIDRGIDNHEIYGISKINEAKVKCGLRFDLTVPLIKYIESNAGNISFPFRRSELGLVWRGERTQSGRYRCFHQYDLDVLIAGNDPFAISSYEAEILTIINEIADRIFPNAVIMINDVGFLRIYLEKLGVTKEMERGVLRIIDKADKLGLQEIASMLQKLGLETKVVRSITEIIEIGSVGVEKTDAMHDLMRKMGLANEDAQRHMSLYSAISEMGGGLSRLRFKPSIARGLEYYTGLVFEVAPDAQCFKSVLSGGSYSNIIQLYDGRKLSGIGASIGVTRLVKSYSRYINVDSVFEKNILICSNRSTSRVCRKMALEAKNLNLNITIFYSNGDLLREGLKLARANNLSHIAIIESDNNVVRIIFRQMTDGKNSESSEDNFVQYLRELASC